MNNNQERVMVFFLLLEISFWSQLELEGFMW